MDSKEIRTKFLKFFESKGHKILPSSSLIPDDPSVLFTTAGMQQFKPYYTNAEFAERDFGVKNVTTSQKCIRTGDIDEVGDNTHLTFFEMLGNFSFGGYGRKEAIEYAYEFITKEMGLSISYVTIYKGEGIVPRDEESERIWKSIDNNLLIKEEGADVFWGPTGDSGPCGPTTEIYCRNATGEDVEIWNVVFNEYISDGSREKLDKGEAKLTKLPILGIDTGMGLERLVTVVNKKESVYDTDLFNGEKTKEERIIADHIKASLFIISDGIVPSNNGAGYVLRRLIRRASRFSDKSLSEIIDKVKDIYKDIYNLEDKGIITEEEEKFKKVLEEGIKKLNNHKTYIMKAKTGEFNLIPGKVVFDLQQSHGLPIDVIKDWAKENNLNVEIDDFNKRMIEHQKLSQTSSQGMFKGGLTDHNEKTIRLHTAHHLLLAGLQNVVGRDVKQRGSNINEERLRIDFLCDHKLSDEEKKKVEDWVNDKINRKLEVVRKEMPREEAEKLGAEMEFGTKYPDVVSVYFILDENGEAISKEFCGGPHVSNTKELGHFKIQKEEAVASGIRRIKAILD